MSERAMRERPLDDAAIDAATEHYARAREREDERLSSAFVFRIGTEWLAFPTSVLDRVADPPTVHSLPHRRGGTTAGLVNVGGDLVVHVSLSGLLGISGEHSAAPGHRAVPRLVVLADARGRLAMTVDDVWGIHHYSAAQVRAVPPTLAKDPSAFTTAMLEVDGRPVGLLSGARVIDALSTAIA